MTEDEARKKWCPFAVASHTDPRQQIGDPKNWLHNCIASECMAWRWGVRPFNATEPMDKPYGYCGLAGGSE